MFHLKKEKHLLLRFGEKKNIFVSLTVCIVNRNLIFINSSFKTNVFISEILWKSIITLTFWISEAEKKADRDKY